MNEITYTVEIADMRAFQRHHRRVSPVIRRLQLFKLLIFAGVSLHSSLHQESESIAFRVTYFFLMLVVLLIAVGVLTFVLTWLTQWRAYRGREGLGVLGQHTITLTPEALHERTAVNDAKAAWRGLLRIDSTPKHIFIFTQSNAAHVIPRRAFPTPADADAFLTMARGYFDAARQSGPC